MDNYVDDSASASSNASVGSAELPEVSYPLNEAVEVPGTDGGLSKTVLVEGSGTRPVKGSKVTVHYVGTLEDGTPFDSSRDRGEHFEFTLGRGQVIKGWDKGVATMRVGEKAVLRCSPDYGYGAAGSPPKIPANATLLFEVELFDWTKEVDISKNKDRSIMKDVLQDGTGYEQPAFEANVTLDLAVYTSYDPKTPSAHAPVWEKTGWEIMVGETTLPPVAESALCSMKKGERAAVRVRGDLIVEACPEFNIPALAERGDNGDITYVFAVHELSAAKTWAYEGQAKVDQGLLRKDRGNAAFKQGDLTLAERYYRRALEFVGEDYGYSDDVKPAAHAARVVVQGNLAQVLLQRGEYTEAASLSKKVLEIEPLNVKALFRLAKAQDGLNEWDEGLRAVNKILEREPSNTDAQQLKARLVAEQKAFDAKQKSMFKKMFA